MEEEPADPGISRTVLQSTVANTTIGGVDDGTMTDIVDKLKILDYERDFCMARTFKPLPHTYFSAANPQHNAGEAFYYFTSLCSWLMELCGHTFATPGQFDDPNATASSIIYELKNMELSVKELAPGKLRTGVGDAVQHVLTMLLDKVLTIKGFQFQLPDYPADTYNEDMEGDGEEEDEVVDEANSESDQSEEYYDFKQTKEGVEGEEEEPAVIETTANPEEWRMELERVAPLLKLNRKPDHKDWRSHLDWISSLLKTIDKAFPEVKTQLQTISDDINKGVEKIQKRESTLAAQFETQVDGFRTQKKDYNALAEQHKSSSDNVNQLSSALNALTEEIDSAKALIAQKEERMKDTTPLLKIKEAMANVKKEIKEMELRIGVLQHTVLQHRMKKQENEKQGGVTEKTRNANTSGGINDLQCPRRRHGATSLPPRKVPMEGMDIKAPTSV